MDMLVCDGIFKLCLVRCHPGHVQDASQGLPGLFSFNWVDQWMMTRLNGFNLGGSSQFQSDELEPSHCLFYSSDDISSFRRWFTKSSLGLLCLSPTDAAHLSHFG